MVIAFSLKIAQSPSKLTCVKALRDCEFHSVMTYHVYALSFKFLLAMHCESLE